MKALLGHHRTRARRAVEALRPYAPEIVARLLGMRKHTIEAILSGRMLPGPRFAAAASHVAAI